MNIDINIYDTSLIPSLMFLLWMLQKYGVPKKHLPIFALFLGILFAFVIIDFSPKGVIVGILIAANAVGFHSGIKNVANAIRDSEQFPD